MSKHDSVILATDLALTVNGTQLVLIRRAKPPFMDKLVLPGGHVEEGETLSEACAREAYEEIGLAIDPGQLKLLTVLDRPGRDPRPGMRVSVVYTLDVSPRVLRELVAGSDALSVELRQLSTLAEEELGFDHWEAVQLLKRRQTMKVLEKGHWLDKWEKEVTCTTKDCGAKLLVGEEDLKAPARYDNEHGRYTVVCPVCGKETDLKKTDLSLRVVEMLDKKRTVHRTYPNPYD